MGKPLLLTTLALLGTAQAQSISATEILARMDAAQKSVRDLSFGVSGSANVNGQAQRIGMQVQAIPAQRLSRVVFTAPDALADNIFIVDNNTSYSYMFLTNQVLVQPLGNQSGGMALNTDLSRITDIAALTRDVDVRLLSSSGNPGSRVYALQMQPKQGAAGQSSRMLVSEQGWRPTRIQLLQGGQVMADINITNYQVNTGLSPARLRALPRDAQVVRQ